MVDGSSRSKPPKTKASHNGARRKHKRPTLLGADAALRATIVRIGLTRAREILKDVEATFAGR
jgi:hypothetical protein